MHKSFKDIWQAINNNDLIHAKQLLNELNCQTSDELRNRDVLMAMVQSKLGNQQQAIDLIQNVINQGNAIANDYNLLGNIYAKQNDFEHAEINYLQAISLQPEYLTALDNLATLYYKHHKLELALKITEQLYQQTNQDKYLYQLTSIYLKLDQVQTAFDLLNANINSNSSSLTLLTQWAQCAFLLNQYELIIKQLSSFEFTNNIQENDLKWYLANSYFQSKYFKEALTYALSILQTDSLYDQINVLIAHCYLALADHDLALKHYLRALQYQKDAAIYFNIGILMEIKQRQKEALEYYQQALSLHPDYFDAYKNIGNLYLGQGAIENALKAYQNALRINPSNAEIQFIIEGLQDKNPSKPPSTFVKNLFDQYAPYYDQHLQQSLKFMVPELIISALKQDHILNNKQKLHVLDLGCGTGLLGTLLDEYSQQLIGVDLSQSMLDLAAKRHCYQQLIHSDLFDLDLPTNSYGLIVASDVLPYLGELNAFFNACNRLNKTNGYLAFSFEATTDNDFFLQKSLRYAHRLTYVESLLKDNGYTIISSNKETLRFNHKKPIAGYIMVCQKVTH